MTRRKHHSARIPVPKEMEFSVAPRAVKSFSTNTQSPVVKRARAARIAVRLPWALAEPRPVAYAHATTKTKQLKLPNIVIVSIAVVNPGARITFLSRAAAPSRKKLPVKITKHKVTAMNNRDLLAR